MYFVQHSGDVVYSLNLDSISKGPSSLSTHWLKLFSFD